MVQLSAKHLFLLSSGGETSLRLIASWYIWRTCLIEFHTNFGHTSDKAQYIVPKKESDSVDVKKVTGWHSPASCYMLFLSTTFSWS